MTKELHDSAADIKIWDRVWGAVQKVPPMDFLSTTVLEYLMRELPDRDGLRCLEAASGTGRISLQLEVQGHRSYLLDMSSEALRVSRLVYGGRGLATKSARGLVSHLPFRDDSFDVVWNSGVLEHFSDEELAQSLAEMGRVCKKGGLVLSFNAYRYSLFYRLGKALLDVLKRWPYAEERSFSTLRPYLLNSGLQLWHERSVGCLTIFVGPFKFVPKLRVLDAALNKVFCSLPRWAWMPVDRVLSRVFGGYLLLTVFRKKGAAPWSG